MVNTKKITRKVIGSKRIFFEIKKGSKPKKGKSLGVFKTKQEALKIAKKISKRQPVTVEAVRIVKAPKRKAVVFFE